MTKEPRPGGVAAFMSEDTKIGGPGGRFPSTRWSAVVAARSADTLERRRGLDAIVAAYWKPVYKYIRIRWGKSNEDAKDLTYAVAAMPSATGKHYYFAIMLPGALVGLIVGYATQRYGRSSQTVAARS